MVTCVGGGGESSLGRGGVANSMGGGEVTSISGGRGETLLVEVKSTLEGRRDAFVGGGGTF